MRTALLTATLFLLAGNVLAQPWEWLKKDNPEIVRYSLRAATCPGPTERYQSIIEAEFVRARIKAVNPTTLWDLAEFVNDDFFLDVAIACHEIAEISDRFAYSVIIRFGITTETVAMLYQVPIYGGVAVGGEEHIENFFRESAAAAITDYLKANFDL